MTIAVQWSPSPNWNQRDARYPLRGDVSHRIVGTAPSALTLFSRPGTASSHFVIGHSQTGDPCPRCPAARGALVIWQCVDLALMAWTNGDVRNPTWPGYQPGVNPNLTTITTEHEDMGAGGGHVVTDHVWEASIAIKKLLRSGNLAAIRAAGIRVGNGAFSAEALVARMAALPVDATTYIDHHQIAGPNKPWCWRDYDRDRGFPSRLPGLLSFLKGEDMLGDYLKTIDWSAPECGGTVTLRGATADSEGATARTEPRFDPSDYDRYKIVTRAQPSEEPFLGWVTGTNITDSAGNVVYPSTRWAVTGSKSHGAVFWHEADVLKVVPPAGGVSPEELKRIQDKANEAGRIEGRARAAKAAAEAVLT